MPRSTTRARIFRALADPGRRETALAVRTPAITGRARRTRATSTRSVPSTGRAAWQAKMPCSSDRPTPSVGHPVNKTAAEKALTAAGKATSSNPARATSIPYRWGWRPPAEGTDCGRPFTTVVAFAKTPPLYRWPEYSFPPPDVHRASGRHPTSHRDDFVRWVHFQLVAQLAALPEIHQRLNLPHVARSSCRAAPTAKRSATGSACEDRTAGGRG
jgi:hypothetical protein